MDLPIWGSGGQVGRLTQTLPTNDPTELSDGFRVWL